MIPEIPEIPGFQIPRIPDSRFQGFQIPDSKDSRFRIPEIPDSRDSRFQRFRIRRIPRIHDERIRGMSGISESLESGIWNI
ncbi:MAG: hypothetical protein IPN69_04620 [Acidobacteria bacterium]|nr:hypothetical protein [Acidobacteriota bacterium]